jgi:predicted HicB family RNase H-like nuclease
MSNNTVEILEVVREASKAAPSWADLVNAIFHPESGVLSKVFKTADERRAFVATEEYKEIKRFIEAAQDRTGFAKGAEPTKSGKLLVRLPRSMHEALDAEAERESVSLNQLVVAKLAVQLASVRERRPDDILPVVVQAYAEVRDGASEDRVVLDPELDAKFLARCRRLGATASDFDLNWRLFFARKNGFTANLPKANRFALPREYVDQYQFASEMALRYVQKKEMEHSWRELSLDRVLCDPILAAAFDEFASRLAPGFKPFEYRWGAIALRKAGRYAKDAAGIEVPIFDDLGRTSALDLSRVPEVQGLYLVQDHNQRLFLGETANLRSRVGLHLKVSGPKMFPDWLYTTTNRDTRLGILPLPSIREGAIKVMELKGIMSLMPLLNYPRTAA